MRFVLDTNTLVSAFLWRGTTAKLLQILHTQQHDILSSEILLSELIEVLKRPKFNTQISKINQTPDQLINQWLDVIELIETTSLVTPVSRDIDDDEVLACAMSAKADYIVSGDKDLLVLKAFRGIPIVTAAQALEALQAT